MTFRKKVQGRGVGSPQTLQGTGQGQSFGPSPPHRVSNLESHTRLEAWDDLVVETSGVEGQRQLFRKVTHLQLYFRADFLSREGQEKVRKWMEEMARCHSHPQRNLPGGPGLALAVPDVEVSLEAARAPLGGCHLLHLRPRPCSLPLSPLVSR